MVKPLWRMSAGNRVDSEGAMPSRSAIELSSSRVESRRTRAGSQTSGAGVPGPPAPAVPGGAAPPAPVPPVPFGITGSSVDDPAMLPTHPAAATSSRRLDHVEQGFGRILFVLHPNDGADFPGDTSLVS